MSIRLFARTLTAVALAIFAPAWSASEPAPRQPSILEVLKQFQAQPTEQAFERIQNRLPSEQRPGGSRVYFVDGDIALRLPQLCAWVQTVTKTPPPVKLCPKPAETAGTTARTKDHLELRAILCGLNNQLCIRLKSDRNIVYTIDETTFVGPTSAAKLTPQEFDQFKDELKAAGDAWWLTEAVCPPIRCNLNITYIDATQRPDGKLIEKDYAFVVRYDAGLPASVNAHSFSPGSPPEDHFMRVGSHFFSYWQTQAYLDGAHQNPMPWLKQWRHTLRHEFGHILGYAHEETANDAACHNAAGRLYAEPLRSTAVDTLEAEDKKSVMHSSICYSIDPSLGKVTGELSKTDRDRHLKYYGG